MGHPTGFTVGPKIGLEGLELTVRANDDATRPLLIAIADPGFCPFLLTALVVRRRRGSMKEYVEARLAERWRKREAQGAAAAAGR